ncbi:selenoprotein domain-containing protein [Histoplasma ohiense]|nr:selenoprotein domain-containing protein [Histoplasma ohiense (nom. inval.)]
MSDLALAAPASTTAQPRQHENEDEAEEKPNLNQQSAIPLAEAHKAHIHLPRVTIKYCTQCKWLLRAAYFAQELLSTFSTALGEVSLVPATGGVFVVSVLHQSIVDFTDAETVIWDRKMEGGFPETKQLKSLVRNIVDPSRDLGHVDRALARKKGGGKAEGAVDTEMAMAAVVQTQAQAGSATATTATTATNICKDCE